MIGRFSSCGPLGVLLALVLVSTISRQVIFVIGSLPVHSLTMIVYVLVVVWGCVL